MFANHEHPNRPQYLASCHAECEEASAESIRLFTHGRRAARFLHQKLKFLPFIPTLAPKQNPSSEIGSNNQYGSEV